MSNNNKNNKNNKGSTPSSRLPESKKVSSSRSSSFPITSTSSSSSRSSSQQIETTEGNRQIKEITKRYNIRLPSRYQSQKTVPTISTLIDDSNNGLSSGQYLTYIMQI